MTTDITRDMRENVGFMFFLILGELFKITDVDRI